MGEDSGLGGNESCRLDGLDIHCAENMDGQVQN